MPSIIENEKMTGRGTDSIGGGLRPGGLAAGLALPVNGSPGNGLPVNGLPVKDSSMTGRPRQGGPSHVGIIMDGNGRWAAARGLPRLEGHRRGLEALRGAVRTAIEFKLAYLTVYSFSAENWSRPIEEVRDLMGLLKRFIRKDLTDLHNAGVRI